MEMTDNQESALSVGTRLRTARQAAGMSINDVSQHIKLTQKQIATIENDGFEELGLVFSRGFVRNYARLVGLDANALMAEMSNTLHGKAESLSIHDEHIPLTSGLSKYWLIMTAIALTLVIGVPLLVYHWLSGDDSPPKIAAAVASVVQPKTAAKPAAPTLPAKTATPQPAQPVPAAAATATTAQPEVTAAPAGNQATGRLQFQFDQDSWVQIRDSKQHTLLSHLYRGGETAEVSGIPPLSLVIGNAPHVTLQYNDQKVDLTAHTAATVARLTLE